MSIRKALGAVKDRTTIGLARVTGSAAAASPDLDVAIVRATSHDDAAPDERHVCEVLRLASASSSPAAPAACVASIARRLSKTRDYVVAAKCLALLHRLASADASGGAGGTQSSPFLHELLRPTLTGRRAGEPVLALLLDFRDEAHTASWDHSAFVRNYSTYLLDRVRFLVLLLPAPRFAADDSSRIVGPPPSQASASGSAADMNTDALLGRARQLRHLLDRLLACRPAGTAGASRVVRAALQPLLADSFRVYSDVARVLAVLLDRFFDTMDYPECVKAFETCVGTAKQIDALREFYDWCDDAGVAGAADLLFPDVRRVDDKLLGTMEQFLRQRGQAGRAEVPRSGRESDVNARGGGDDVDDMNGIKALPAPPARSSGERSRPAAVVAAKEEGDQSVLVDLRDPAATADEQGNKLALALFAAPPAATNGNNNDWVTFASESDADAPTVTSAWQTPAAEPGKADWELALVETASNLSKQTASLGGGMDTLLLGGMYDQGAVRQHVAAQAASGSASSVALLPRGHGGASAAPVLMLPGPDGTVQAVVGGDPFAASLAVPPPSYVQMAEMERKQQLLVQEQQMWAQYRQGGMQGQPSGFNGLAGGMAMPYGGYGMPPMAYNQQVGGYY